MEGVFMTHVEINYHNFSNEELRKLIEIHTNIAYTVPEETVYLPIEIRSDFVCTSTKHIDSSKTFSYSLDIK
jgi:hypothetical protein